MSAVRYFLALALVIGTAEVATFSWVDHWNVLVSLMLSLGALGCYVTAVVALHTGSPSGKERP